MQNHTQRATDHKRKLYSTHKYICPRQCTKVLRDLRSHCGRIDDYWSYQEILRVEYRFSLDSMSYTCVVTRTLLSCPCRLLHSLKFHKYSHYSAHLHKANNATQSLKSRIINHLHFSANFTITEKEGEFRTPKYNARYSKWSMSNLAYSSQNALICFNSIFQSPLNEDRTGMRSSKVTGS